jgi:competence protein ComEC
VRFDPVLAVCLALLFGAFGRAAPLVSGLALALGLWLVRGQYDRVARGLIALAFGLSWLRAELVLTQFRAQHGALVTFIAGPQRCAFDAEVATSPTVRDGTPDFVARVRELDCEGRRHSASTHLRLYGGPLTLARGDRFHAVAQLAAVSPLENLDLPDPWPRAARLGATLSGSLLALDRGERGVGLAAAIDRARAFVRARIEATFVPELRGMAKALVLGDGDLAPEDRRAFNQSGLSHLLAVSGTHLVFAVLSLVKACQALLRRWLWLAARRDVGRYAAWLGVVLAPLYADFAGGSGSAWRAALLLVAVLGTRGVGRHVLIGRALGLSLAAAWLGDALVAYDYSFLLSLAATVGLIVASPLAREVQRLEPNKALRNVLTLATATGAATLPCIPLLLLLSPGLTLASLAANCLAAPFGETIALPLCLVHALSAWWPGLERALALAGSGALSLVKGLAHTSASIDWLYIELPPLGAVQVSLLGLASLSLLAQQGRPWRDMESGSCSQPTLELAALRSSQAHPRPSPPAPLPSNATTSRQPARCWAPLLLAALAFAGAELYARRAGTPHGLLRVTALDVGQGDATLVDLPDGRLLLIDAGGSPGGGIDPGEYAVLPTLRARRRAHVDVVVLSHPHPDHFGGLLALAKAVSIGEFWDTGQGQAEGAGPVYRELLETLQRRGVPIRWPAELCAGAPERRDYRVEVLAPCPDYRRGLGANDNSLVVRVVYGQDAALFTGDSEREAEESLLALPHERLRATLLKVGHHGSRTSSSPELVRAVSPRVATISSDIRNGFGHPHARTLETLSALGVTTLRLDQRGACQWWSDGEQTSWRCFEP